MSTALVPVAIYIHLRFQVNSFQSLHVMLRKKIHENTKWDITEKWDKSYFSLALHFTLLQSVFILSFTSIYSKVMLWTKIK